MANEVAESLRIITVEEVRQHATMKDCWIILGTPDNKMVYDVTKYLADHPGGPEVILEMAGQDAEEIFRDIGHSNYALTLLKQFLIGKLEGVVEGQAADNQNCRVG